jgi:hypothetical protein
MSLTESEWKEMDDLRKAITEYPHSVHPDKQEKFTKLFVRSLEGKSDELCHSENWHTSP